MAIERLYDFLIEVSRKKISKIEIHNYLEGLTDNFNYKKVKILHEDVLEFISYSLLREEELEIIDDETDEFNRLEPLNEIEYFLTEKMIEYEAEMIEHEKLNKINSNLLKQETENSSCVEKIVLLKELGVLSFLKNKDKISNNKIALILSSVIKEKITTIQPILNPILNQNKSKNNPYDGASSKPLEKVKHKLYNMEIGYEYEGPKKVYL